MSTKINEAVLLRTSAASDAICSGGVLAIAGLKTSTKTSNIYSIKEVLYKAEVSQVVTIAGVDTTWTPTGSTVYGVYIGDPRKNVNGSQNLMKPYTYTTTVSLAAEGATAQLRREYIATQIVAKINADTSNNVLAATTSNGTYTITDDAGYNPNLLSDWNILYQQGQSGRQGKSTVGIWSDSTGYGYVSNNIAVTTQAVYAVGVGANLAKGAPVMDFMYGNLISGTLIAPPLTADGLSAVSGQKYNAFVILSYDLASAHNQTGQYALVNKIQTIWVDNGTGSDTTNASGFTAFEKVMFRHISDLYKNDWNSIVEFWDNRPSFSGIGTAGIPTGSDGDINTLLTKTSQAPYYIKGASTQIFPLWDATNGSGLIWDLDNAAEGLEWAGQPLGTPHQNFVVGKQTFSFYYKGTITDVSQANPFYVGFRTKVAFNTAISGYANYAALGFNASAATQTINVMTNLNSAGEVSTSSTKTWADTATHVFEIKVDIAGKAWFYVDGVDVTSVQATAYVFPAGTTVIPFVRAIGTGSGVPTNTSNTILVLGDNTWRM